MRGEGIRQLSSQDVQQQDLEYEVEWLIKIIPKARFLERIRGFIEHPSTIELIYVGLIESGVDSLKPIERSSLWRVMGNLIDLAREAGLKILGYGIEKDRHIFMVLSK